MNNSRVALVFDNRSRPETTGSYCLRALRGLTDVEHILPDAVSNIGPGRFDLFLFVDDGLMTSLPANLPLTAFWAIDTHIQFERSFKIASQADFVFAAQQNGTERLRAAGLEMAQWLPLACDPGLHCRHDVPTEWDVAFVGHVMPGPRAELLRHIQRRYPNSFVGQRYFEEMARAYSAARIVFNRSVADDINMRVFETLACGSLLLTNDLKENGQSELFQNGRHLATYSDAEELIEKIDWFLRHEEQRTSIAAAGRELVLLRHTYRHRMQTILDTVGSRTAATQVPVAQQPSQCQTNAHMKHRAYFEFERPELVERVPTVARRVLDVGCGAGMLGAALKQRSAIEVWGIERDSEIAGLAQTRLDRVIHRNAEDVDAEVAGERFDAIVCGDVLEHLRDPLAFLRRCHDWLTGDGCLIASIPNVRHWTVIASLLEGNWTYEWAGLLDEDHVRFFTRREIEKLFFRAGFEVSAIDPVPGPGYEAWAQGGRSGTVNVGRLELIGLSPQQAEEFYTYQFLVNARPAKTPDFGVTSIIIVTHNELAYTRRCVESIRLVTDEPYELVFIDNGSTDGTPGYLESIEEAQLIRNAENLGFPAAANQGIAAATGENLLLLNNDTIVTTGWLRRMLDTLNSDPEIGLVGPLSNNVSGVQQIAVDYKDFAQLDGFAWDLGWRQRGRTDNVERLVGFCLLFGRNLIEQIGLLDEQFGIGCFEDDDYCRRAIRAGYRAVVAQDAFVHHFGSRTFRACGVDLQQVLQDNQARFAAKWNATGGEESMPTQEIAGRSSHIPNAAAENEVPIESSNLQLSLCMIVRDNEQTIRKCLESIRPWVDEMIVVDTGSTDRTPDIARQMGGRVFEFPWCDDFSAARNESLRHASGEWVFWMDSDDTILPECGQKLRALADGPHDELTLGYVMQVHCPSADGEDVTVVDHVKLFPNRKNLRFEHRIHEQILPAIRRAGGDVKFTDIYVTHSGADHSAEGRRRKLERDFRILQKDLADRPEHPFVLFNLGMTCTDAGRYDEAIDFLRRSIDVAQPGESHLRKAYALLLSSLSQSDQYETAAEVCQKALKLFPDDNELLFRSGMLHHHFGRHKEAEASYLRLLNNSGERYFQSVDSGIAGYKARHNLAVLYEDEGRLADAEEQWRLSVEERPHYRCGWRGLAECLIKQGKSTEAFVLARQLQETPVLSSLGVIVSSRLSEQTGNVRAARQHLEQALEQSSDDAELLDALARLLFERFSPDAAEETLRRLVDLDPENASTLFNLGCACLNAGRTCEAKSWLRKSLAQRPDHPATHRMLASAIAAQD